MLQLQRQQDIMDILKKKKEQTVKELCAALYCSPATIRRDLCSLEKQGLLRRSFGGAVLNESFFDQQPLLIRAVKNIAEKQRICAKAAKLICPGQTIFIDSSSTTYFLAPYLRDIPELTVVTNNPYLNVVLSQMKVNNYCTGGKMLTSSIALVGSEAERFIRGIHADAFFFSARGICNGQIFDSSKNERDIKITMLEHSDKHYFLCDSTKLEQSYPYKIADQSLIDETITE
ncbi:MAG: DeoR/GlpR transcriptional regulator [Clostridia bacterium]|nr:DeoR/GlpR transcriptional regulator [Clostridia bacterium]